MGIRENKVEAYLDAEVKKLGGLTRKWVCPSHCGVPDRIVLIKRVTMFVEVKTDDGRLSPMQEREIDRLTSMGARVRVIYGYQGVDELIEELKNELR